MFLSLSSASMMGCSGSEPATGGPDLGSPVEAADLSVGPDLLLPPRDPTDHPENPTISKGTGAVIASPEVWTIVWSVDEELGHEVDTFLGWMLQSDDYWIATLGQYGIGKGTAKGVLVIDETPPKTLDDAQVIPLIKAHITDGSFPAPNDNTVYSFVLPQATTSTQGSYATGCTDYGGYHSAGRVVTGGKSVPYAINLNCKGGGFAGNTEFDSVTDVVSHEIAEVATDPVPPRGWYGDQYEYFGSEVSDLCFNLYSVFKVEVPSAEADGGVTERTYFVTRNWSNAAARAGNQDPCQPAPADKPYFNVAASPRQIDITGSSDEDVTFQGEFQPFAYGDVGKIKWTVEGDPGPGVTIEPMSGSGLAGDTIPFTITVSKTAQSNLYPLYIYAQSAKGGHNEYLANIVVH